MPTPKPDSRPEPQERTVPPSSDPLRDGQLPPRTRLTEEEDRSLAHAAAMLGRRWKSLLSDAHTRVDYRGLGLSQYTIGNLQTALTKLGPAGLQKLKGLPTSRD